MKHQALSLSVVLFLVTALCGSAETYRADPIHSYVSFSVKHMGIARVRGKFKEFSVVLDYEEGNVASLSVTARVEVAGIDTGWAARDEHLLGENFFDADQYPEIVFVGKEVLEEDGQQFLKGTFTMHGVTKDVRLPFTLSGPVKGMQGEKRIGFFATTTVNRHHYGVDSAAVTDNLVGANVDLEISIEAVAE